MFTPSPCFSTSCYLPKPSFTTSCQLSPSRSPTRPPKLIHNQLQSTQLNIISLHRHLNRLRPRIAILQMMKQKVQAASLVQKGLIQKRISSEYEKGVIKRRRERSICMSRDMEKRMVEKRREFEEYQMARKSQEFKRGKDEIKERRESQEKRILEGNREIYELGRKEHMWQKQKMMRCSMFKERRAKSFHEEKLKRLESQNLRKVEKIEKLSQVCRSKEGKSRVGVGMGKREGVKVIERIVREIKEGLTEMKEIKLRVEG